MSKQLYEEALADVKKLKEVAEDNAKRALLEAVTPRIKDLIENQLLGETEFDPRSGKDDLLLDELPVAEKEDQLSLPFDDESSVDDEFPEYPGMEPPLSHQGDLPSEKNKDVYELSVESARALGLLVNESNSQFDKKLSSIAQKLDQLSGASRIIKESAGFDEVLSSLATEVEDTYAQVQENLDPSKKKSSYESILEMYYSTLKQLTERKMKTKRTLSEADVTLKLTGLPDEVDLESIGVDLVSGEEDSEDEDLDLGDEEMGEEEDEEMGEEEDEETGDKDAAEDMEDEEESDTKTESLRLSDNLVVEIDEGMLRREISRMKALREAKEDVQSWGHGPGDVSDEFEDEDMGDPFLDVDLTTETVADASKKTPGADAAGDLEEDDKDSVDEYDMNEYELDEVDELDELEQAEDVAQYHGAPESAQSSKQSRQPGATVESLRRQLAAEARLQSEAKQKAQKAQQKSKQSQKEAQQKHKAAQSQMKEAQKQASQGKKVQAKQNKQLAQKKHQESQQKKKQAKQMQEAYVFYAQRFNESVRRTRQLKGMLNEAVRQGSTLNSAPTRSAGETTDLRNKLAETNLFNTKLLFANKVLQNESFTRSQKAGIIERLDEAHSEREVKLVYESLVKTLDNTTRRQVNESRERAVMGSSSRPTKPSSTLNEGFETDRWARLAGIVK